MLFSWLCAFGDAWWTGVLTDGAGVLHLDVRVFVGIGVIVVVGGSSIRRAVIRLLVHPGLIVHPIFGEAFNIVACAGRELWMGGVDGAIAEDKDLGGVNAVNEVFGGSYTLFVVGVDKDAVFSEHPGFIHVMSFVSEDVACGVAREFFVPPRYSAEGGDGNLGAFGANEEAGHAIGAIDDGAGAGVEAWGGAGFETNWSVHPRFVVE